MEEKMYKAKIEIGGYKIGDEVPAEKAELWISMYTESPVEKVDKKPTVELTKESVVTENPMHDDYINRNADVVKKAISEDNLNKKTLISLLKMESTGKKRGPVIDTIREKIKSL